MTNVQLLVLKLLEAKTQIKFWPCNNDPLHILVNLEHKRSTVVVGHTDNQIHSFAVCLPSEDFTLVMAEEFMTTTGSQSKIKLPKLKGDVSTFHTIVANIISECGVYNAFELDTKTVFEPLKLGKKVTGALTSLDISKCRLIIDKDLDLIIVGPEESGQFFSLTKEGHIYELATNEELAFN